MKINEIHLHKILEAYQTRTKQPVKGDRVKKEEEARGEKSLLEISPEARELQRYRQKLAGIELERPELVRSLQRQIEEGTFQIDALKIAAGIMEEINEEGS